MPRSAAVAAVMSANTIHACRASQGGPQRERGHWAALDASVRLARHFATPAHAACRCAWPRCRRFCQTARTGRRAAASALQGCRRGSACASCRRGGRRCPLGGPHRPPTMLLDLLLQVGHVERLVGGDVHRAGTGGLRWAGAARQAGPCGWRGRGGGRSGGGAPSGQPKSLAFYPGPRAKSGRAPAPLLFLAPAEGTTPW